MVLKHVHVVVLSASVYTRLYICTNLDCAVSGVLAWVTVNFLTGKTLLVFCWAGVSGCGAHTWGCSVHRAGPEKDCCLLSEVTSLNHWPHTGYKNMQYFYTAAIARDLFSTTDPWLQNSCMCVLLVATAVTCQCVFWHKWNKFQLELEMNQRFLNNEFKLIRRFFQMLTLSPCPAGHLYSNTRRTVGILDLGGGSTQITFLPKSKVSRTLTITSLSKNAEVKNWDLIKHELSIQQKTIDAAPSSYIARFNLFNSTYQLYTHR